jgi:multidrug resistance efflux pump
MAAVATSEGRVRAIRATITIVLMAIAIALAVMYWRFQRVNPTTDDAFVQADIVGMAAQVSGPLVGVYVVDNQTVKRGDLLFEIDERPFAYALAEAEAKRDLALQDVQADESAVNAADAEAKTRQAQVEYARQYLERIRPLVAKNYMSQNKLDDASSQYRAASAQLDRALHDLEKARQVLGANGAANARLRLAEAAVRQAQLNLGYCQVFAPVNGLVTNLNLPVGTYVNAGQQIFALVDQDSFWFSANFKETFLDRIRPGQPATITLNSYRDRPFQGVVQGIGWGVHQQDGATLRLLPNVSPVVYWVQLASRFPVRIGFSELDPARPLRIGANGWVTIHTEGVDIDAPQPPALDPRSILGGKPAPAPLIPEGEPPKADAQDHRQAEK